MTPSKGLVLTVQSIDPAESLRIKEWISSRQTPDVLWIDEQYLGVNAPARSIDLVVTIPQDTRERSKHYCCGIDARLAPVTMYTNRNKVKHMRGFPDSWADTGTYNESWPQLRLAANWAENITPTLTDDRNNSIRPFAELVSAGGLWNSSTKTPPWQTDTGIVESALASLVSNALSRISYNTSMVGTLRGMNQPNNPWSGGAFANEFLPQGQLGKGGKAYQISPAELARATILTMEAKAEGYAYSRSSGTTKSAMCVLGVYAVLALGHIAFACITGWSSNCWDTASEIAVLAFNTASSDTFKNTGAGIRTMGTYSKPIQVVAKDGKLVIATLERSLSQSHEKIKPGQAYG
ncbi:hypothetical protein MBLNU230_g0767t1 [Neophaeotheca triangularis]